MGGRIRPSYKSNVDISNFCCKEKSPWKLKSEVRLMLYSRKANLFNDIKDVTVTETKTPCSFIIFSLLISINL